MAVVFTSDTLHTNRNLAFLTTKNKIFLVFFKLEAIQANGKQIEEGLTTVDVSVTSVIHALTAEGTKIKALVDRHIQKMIKQNLPCVLHISI
jgi:hypothetical protein